MEYIFTIHLLDLLIDTSSFFSSFARTFYTFNYNFYLPQLENIYYHHHDNEDFDGDDYPEFMEESFVSIRYTEVHNTEENERFDDLYSYEDADAYFILNFEDLLTVGPYFKKLILPLIVNELSFSL